MASLSLPLDESFLTREELTTIGSFLGLGGGEQVGLPILSELLLVAAGLTMDRGLYLGVVLPSPDSLPLLVFFLGSGDSLSDELVSGLNFEVSILLFLGASLSDPDELLSCLLPSTPGLLSESLLLPLFCLSFDLRSPFTGDLLLEELFFLSLDLRSPLGGDLLFEELLSRLFLGGDRGRLSLRSFDRDLLSRDRLLSGDRRLSCDRLFSGDRLLSGDRLFSGDCLFSGDRDLVLGLRFFSLSSLAAFLSRS